MFKPPGECPVCGEFVPRKALACNECGSDARTGWKGDHIHDGLDLPDDDFNYDDFAASEFGIGRPKSGIKPFWVMTAMVLLAVFIWALIKGW
jgi:hypothetical protein